MSTEKRLIENDILTVAISFRLYLQSLFGQRDFNDSYNVENNT